jgi:hypothetical protein
MDKPFLKIHNTTDLESLEARENWVVPQNVRTMLEHTLSSYWVEYIEYGGDAQDSEAFWEYVVGPVY